MNLGELVVYLKANMRDFQVGMDRAKRMMHSFSLSAGLYMGRAAKAVTAFALGAGRRLALFATRYVKLAALALAGLGAVAVKSAMEVEEANNFFRESFKDLTAAAWRWADQYSKSLKLSAVETRKYLATFNEMLTGMGIAQDAAFQLSREFTQMTIDLASFRDMGLDEAFEKITSAIVGMPRPMQNLGYVMKDAQVQAEAYRLGIAEVGTELTEQQKVLARYALMMRLAGNAVGDMERTMDSATNIFRSLWSHIKDLGRAFGEILLPHVTRVARAMRDYLERNMAAMTASFEALVTNIGRIVDWLPKNWKTAFKAAMDTAVNIVRLGIEAIAIMVEEGMYYIGQNMPKWLWTGFTRVWDSIKKQLSQIFEGSVKDIAFRMGEIATYGGVLPWALATAHGDPQAAMGQRLESTWRSFQERMAGVANNLRESGLDLVTRDMLLFQEAVKAADEWVGKFGDGLGDMNMSLDELQKSIEENTVDVTRWKELYQTTAQAMSDTFGTAFADIVEDARSAGEILENTLKRIQRIFSEMIWMRFFDQPVRETLGGFINNIGSMFAPAAASTGGLVYAQRGTFIPRGTDTVPAMLTPGEGVLDADLTDRLRSALAVEPVQSGGGGGTINMVVTAIDAKSAYDFLYTNRRALASMLQQTHAGNHPYRRERR